jgi:GNAT superfamily N-acetyltransferase
MRLRAWRPDDRAGVDALLDPDADPLWAQQSHQLHGEPRDGTRWRRTLVGEDHGELVGAVTVARNYVHPGRYSCPIEVAPAHRRRGLGRRLVAAARNLRPEPLPLAGKFRERDEEAGAFLAAIGGRVYQRAPCPVVRPADPAVAAWCAAQPGGATDLGGVPPEQLATAFADVYRWQHAAWSPVGSESALAEVSAGIAADVDGRLSAALWRAGRLSAIALVFPSAGGLECVAETLHPDEPDGVAALAAAVAAMLRAAAAAGIAEIEFDGHDDDPHLPAVLGTLPVARTDPLLIAEIP